MSSFSQPKNRIDEPIIINPINDCDLIKSDNINIHNLASNNIKTENTICKLIDTINENNLNFFYKDNISNFKYNIDQLNLQFYLETEKILSSNNTSCHNENKLFLILFKQINLYIKEIERLNTILIDQAKEPNSLKKKMVIINQKKNDLETKEMLIQTLKNSIKSLENKLSKLIQSENNLKEENDNLKKKIQYYKEQYENSLGISSISISNTTNSQTIRKNKRTFSDINQSFLNNAPITVNQQSKNDLNFYVNTPQKKSISKLKIIKAVKNKVSNSSNKKNDSNISNSNTTSITNNINSNSGSNRSSNIVDENGINKTQKLNINIVKIKKTTSNPFCSHHFHSNSNNLPVTNRDNIHLTILNRKNYDEELENLEHFQDLLIEVKDYLIEKCNNEVDFAILLNDNNNQHHNTNISFENNFEGFSGKDKNEKEK